jgi:methionyl-tRNA formyltransferase
MRVTFLGMPCAGSAPVLAALLGATGGASAGIEVASVALAAPGGLAGESPVERTATAAGARLPMVAARSVAEAAARIAADAPDAVVAACFPWRLPAGVLARSPGPRLGFLNVHPSLLPRGRGPEPVFWTLRRGERETGATVHLMDEGLDTGPILAQASIPVPDDPRAPELERDLMALGGRLLVEALPKLAAGALRPVPQPADGATHAPLSSPADWLLPTTLPAAWAWRFANAVAPLAGPLAAQGPFGTLPVRAAVAHDPLARPALALAHHADGTTTIRFSPGWVRFVR